MRIGAVILNWNGWRDTIACAETLRCPKYHELEIVVVDNGSKDQSVERLLDWSASRSRVLMEESAEWMGDGVSRCWAWTERRKPAGRFDRLVLVECRHNLGFAGGCNIGIRYVMKTGADTILLLNNDVEADGDLLSRLARESERDKGIGILAPTVLEYSARGEVQSAGGAMNLWTGRGRLLGAGRKYEAIGDAVVDVDWVSGAALMIRRAVLEVLGMLDERFFLTYEETDYCLRARRHGYRVVVVSDAAVYHKGGASMSGLIAEYYLTRNRPLFMAKNARPIQWPTFLGFYAVGTLNRIIKFLWSGEWAVAQAVIRGFVAGIRLAIQERLGSGRSDGSCKSRYDQGDESTRGLW